MLERPLSQPSKGGHSALTERLFRAGQTCDQALRRFGYRWRQLAPEAESRADDADDDQTIGQTIERLAERNRLRQPDAMAGVHEGSSREGRIIRFKEDLDLARPRQTLVRLANGVDHDTNGSVLPQP